MSNPDVKKFDLISRVIGEEFEKAYQSIWDRLSKGQATASLAGAGMSADDLREYFLLLNGVSCDMRIHCRETKGDGYVGGAARVVYGQGLVQGSGPSAVGIEGSISIGIGVKF